MVRKSQPLRSAKRIRTRVKSAILEQTLAPSPRSSPKTGANDPKNNSENETRAGFLGLCFIGIGLFTWGVKLEGRSNFYDNSCIFYFKFLLMIFVDLFLNLVFIPDKIIQFHVTRNTATRSWRVQRDLDPSLA